MSKNSWNLEVSRFQAWRNHQWTLSTTHFFLTPLCHLRLIPRLAPGGIKLRVAAGALCFLFKSRKREGIKVILVMIRPLSSHSHWWPRQLPVECSQEPLLGLRMELLPLQKQCSPKDKTKGNSLKSSCAKIQHTNLADKFRSFKVPSLSLLWW